MLIFSKSKSGLLTFSNNNTQVHSLYNPDAEAQKYIDAVSAETKIIPEIIILVGPGLNYLLQHIRNKYPAARILIVHFSTELYQKTVNADNDENAGDNNYISHWHPNMDITLKFFLYKNIEEIDLFNKLIITWEPSLKAFPETAKNCLAVINQVLGEYSANISTVSYFGKRYIKNILRNISDISSIAVPGKIEKPVVVTASGASLVKSIELIKKYRDNIFIIALSSSCRLLSEYEIIPEIVISTDPGYYASCHINFSFNEKSILAAPLTSYPVHFYNKNIFMLNQGSFLENYFLEKVLLPCIRINTCGTVAGSAYYLTSALTDYPVIFAGLDLCSTDIISHALPNSFNYLTVNRQNRMHPQYDILFKEINDNYPFQVNKQTRTSTQLKAYAGWFNSAQIKNNYYRINKSDVILSLFKDITESDFKSIALSSIKNDNYKLSELWDIKSIDSGIYLKKVDSALLELIERLKKLYIIKTAEPETINLRSSFENEILYFYNTSKYFSLIDFHKKGDYAAFSSQYFSLVESCIFFLEKNCSIISSRKDYE